MCSAQVSEPHQSAQLTSVPCWRLIAAKGLPEFRLELTFHDGLRGVIELAALIHGDDAGVFAALRDPRIFESVRVEHGAPCWLDDVDLAPDALYAVIKSGSSIFHSPFPIPGS